MNVQYVLDHQVVAELQVVQGLLKYGTVFGVYWAGSAVTICPGHSLFDLLAHLVNAGKAIEGEQLGILV